MNALSSEARLARHAFTLGFNDVPSAAQGAVEDLLIDTAACMLASLRSADCVRIRDAYVLLGGTPEASLVGCGARLPATQAALLNGVFAHWFEWDDVHHPSVLHASAVIFPALSAAAESASQVDGARSGREFVAAIVAAFDVAARVSEAIVPGMSNGWMPTGNGVVGAAAGAARLLGLDEAGVLSAMGIAASTAGVGRQPIKDRISGKNILCGLVAGDAVRAALLARAGVQGAPNFLFGDFGMARLLAGAEADEPRAVAELGERFSIIESAVKPYPCCRSTHGCVDVVLDLLAAEPTLAERVAGVELRLPRTNLELVGAPFAPGDNPRVSAQFSVAYTVALALRHGGISIDDFDPARIVSEKAIETLARSIRIADSGNDRHEVRLRLNDGSERVGATVDLKGTPQRPLGESERRAKVDAAVTGIGPADCATSLITAARDVANQGLAPVLDLLRQAVPGKTPAAA